jgi:hypothetical protein
VSGTAPQRQRRSVITTDLTERSMRSILLWALGVPIPIIILIWLLY